MTTNTAPYPVELLKMPRQGRWEFPLHFFTSQFYTCFWLCVRIAEVNRFTSHKFIPWLWFFVPFAPFVQPFAFFVLNQELSKLEEQNNVTYKKPYYYLAVTIIFLCTVYMSSNGESEWDIWFTGASLFISSIAYLVINSRINQLKLALKNVEFKGKDKGYSVFEWVLVTGIVSLIIGFIAYIKFYESYLTDIKIPPLNHIQTYNNNNIFHHPSGEYKLTFSGDNWQQVPLGSISDGSAEYEFVSSLDSGYFIIFKFKNNQTIDQLINSRLQWIEEVADLPACSESRSFIADSTFIKANLVCKSTVTDSYQWSSVTLLEGPKYTYELIGRFEAPKLAYDRWEKHFALMATEFSNEN